MSHDFTRYLIVLLSFVGQTFIGFELPAEEKTPVLVKVVTTEKSVIVGEIKEQTDAQISLVELTTGQTRAISKEQVHQIRMNVSENEAAHSVGLGNLLAWKILKTLPKNSPVGRIVKIDQATIYVSLGKNAGAKVGEELRVYRGETELKDPVTGEVLGRERKLIARLIVVEVRENFSKARTQSDLETTFEVGDVTERTNANNAVAVFPLVTLEGATTATGVSLAEQVTTALVQRKVNVIERSQLATALAELLIQNISIFDAEKAQRLGKQLGASAALVGTLNVVNKTIDLNIRLVEVETGRILFAGEYRLYDTRADLSPITVAPPTAAKGEAAAKPAAAGKDSRKQWRLVTYDQTIYHVEGKQWVQKDNNTGKISANLVEIRRTSEYVEMSGFNFGVGRLSATRLEMNKADKWEWVGNGNWEQP